MSTRTIKQKTCLRCGRTWWPKTPERPTACPTCRSAYWDKERVYKQRNVNAPREGRAGARTLDADVGGLNQEDEK